MSFFKKLLRKKDSKKLGEGYGQEDEQTDHLSSQNFGMQEAQVQGTGQGNFPDMNFGHQVDPILAQQQQIQQQMLMMSMIQQQPLKEKTRSKYELSEEANFYVDVLKDDFYDPEDKTNSPSSPSKIDTFNQESSGTDNTHSKPEKNQNLGRWTDEEHQLFLEGLRIYGKDWESVEKHIGTRDAAHVRSHAQKFVSKLVKSMKKNKEDPDIKFYYDILNQKMSKPIKRKRKNRKSSDVDEDGPYGDEYDDEIPQGNIFKVEKDQQAIQKKIAFNNVQPSQILRQDMQDTAFQSWKNQFSNRDPNQINPQFQENTIHHGNHQHDNQSMNSDECIKPTPGLFGQGMQYNSANVKLNKSIPNSNSSGSGSGGQRPSDKSGGSGSGGSGGSGLSQEQQEMLNNMILQQQMHQQIQMQLQQQIQAMQAQNQNPSEFGALNMNIRSDLESSYNYPQGIPPMIIQFNQYNTYNFPQNEPDQIQTTVNVNNDAISMEGRSDYKGSERSEENFAHNFDVQNFFGSNEDRNRTNSGNGPNPHQAQHEQNSEDEMHD